MPRKFLASFALSMIAVMAVPAVAFAHVIVTPSQAGIGQELTFNVSVPNERQVPVTNLKLDIPAGVTDVTPTVANGWTIQTPTNGSTSNPEVTAIVWTNGSIPVGEREDFSFSAQLPASPTKLDWKAYQTYADGTIVQWNGNPAVSGKAVADNIGPYSITRVVNDLNSPAATTSSANTTLALVLSIAALVLSVAALMMRWRR